MALAVECVGHRVGPLHTIPWRLALLAGIGVLVLGLAGYGACCTAGGFPWCPQCSPGGCPQVPLYVSYQERMQRSVLMRLFAQSVSPEVAQTLWQQREQFMADSRPHPQRLTRQCSLPIWKFTSVSECLGEQALVDWLATYLNHVAAGDGPWRCHQ